MFNWFSKPTKKPPIKARPRRAAAARQDAGWDDERRRLFLLMREVRKKISPEVLARAQEAAETQVPPEPVENEASRLFRLAHENGGAKREQVLAFLERKFKDKLN